MGQYLLKTYDIEPTDFLHMDKVVDGTHAYALCMLDAKDICNALHFFEKIINHTE